MIRMKPTTDPWYEEIGGNDTHLNCLEILQ